MREYTVPDEVEVDPATNLADMVFQNADTEPDRVAFLRKVDDKWTEITARQFRDDVTALAKGFVAAGIKPGERIGLLSRTRYEWTLADYAIWTAGCVTVPIYETSSPEQVAWILGDSGAAAVVVETDTHRKTFEEISGEVTGVRHVWGIDAGEVTDLMATGGDVTDDVLTERRRSVTAESLATIIYTSGTTGRPKGCELTHGNFMFDSAATTQTLTRLFDTSGAATLLFLPLAHVFARIIQIGCVRNNVRMGHTHDIKNLLADFKAFQPTFILSVPRIFEKVYNTAKNQAHASGRGKLFDRAEAVAIKYSEALDGDGPSFVLRGQHALWDRLVYSKLRDALGGKTEYAVSGGAPLGARLGHFFRGVGITVLEGYGLTETTAGATLNLPHEMKVGTVGRPIPGEAVRIAEDGEILLKGRNIFRGYYNNNQATNEALESDGWFHTGDIGELDDDGYLKITGRKKELIVTAGGKNVSPAVLEDRLRAHALISQAMVVGDNQPFIACLITLDADALNDWKKQHGKDQGASAEDLKDDDDLVKTIQSAVDDANKAVSHAEAIKKFRILPVDFTEEGGQLTPTLKVKRNVVAKEFESDIDALYTK